jgi:hypothetical protein
MSRFAASLREISGRLNLPQPARARVLTEIAGDLDDLYQAFLERGASEEDAERQALGRIDLSDDALRGLARVHGSWFRRLSDSIAERAGSRWELALVGLLVLLAVFLSGAVVQAVPISRAAGPWLIPVACAAVATLGIGAWKAHVLWLRGDHRPKGLRTGLGAMLEPTQAAITTMHWLLGVLALLVMSLSLALVSGLAWFILLGKVASIERADAAALLPD